MVRSGEIKILKGIKPLKVYLKQFCLSACLSVFPGYKLSAPLLPLEIYLVCLYEAQFFLYNLTTVIINKRFVGFHCLFASKETFQFCCSTNELVILCIVATSLLLLLLITQLVSSILCIHCFTQNWP